MEDDLSLPGSSSTGLELMVVGDIHGCWDAEDQDFLEGGSQDVAIFVGDFGDEDLELVGRVAAMRCRKAVMLGNHDAWYASRGGGLGRARRQLELLADGSLGFAAIGLPGGEHVLVGGRPFSWGGPMGRFAQFFQALLEVADEETSAERIVQAARRWPQAAVILVGHNGPAGLGEGRDAIFGRDFLAPHVDFGDVDLELALRHLRKEERPVPLTVAGHMHSSLRGGGLRQRVVHQEGTLHLNAAVVPRHREGPNGRQRHFVRVRVEGERVVRMEDLWVGQGGRIEEVVPLLG